MIKRFADVYFGENFTVFLVRYFRIILPSVFISYLLGSMFPVLGSIFGLDMLVVPLYITLAYFYPTTIFGLIGSLFFVWAKKSFILIGRLKFSKLPGFPIEVLIVFLGLFGIFFFSFILIFYTIYFVGWLYGVNLGDSWHITIVFSVDTVGIFLDRSFSLTLSVNIYLILFVVGFIALNYWRMKNRHNKVREELLKKWLNIKGIYENL
ncbi:MAG: hypothetical protein ACP6IP_04225 [Candidatus Njordarchaeia archaeon]